MEAKMVMKQESWRRLARGGFNSNVSLDHALPIEQQKRRAAQWPQIQEAKEKGWSEMEQGRTVATDSGGQGVGVEMEME